MSTFVKKYPRAKISRHATLNGWVIDLIQRETAKPKRVAATYASIAWADRAARAKLGLPVPASTPPVPRPAPVAPATPSTPPAPAAPVAVSRVEARSDAGTCRSCNRPMRPAGTKVSDYPNTVLRQREGLCQSCYQRGGRAPKKSKGEAVVEDVEFLAKTGASREEISERLNTSWPTIERMLHRYGRNDLLLVAKPKDLDKAEAARKKYAA